MSSYLGKKCWDASQEWNCCETQKPLWLLRSNREQQVQATKDLHTITHAHYGTYILLHTHTHTHHPPLLDVAVTWSNSKPGWLPWVLVSRLNGLLASKTWRVKKNREWWGGRGGEQKELQEQREKHGREWRSRRSRRRWWRSWCSERRRWWLICSSVVMLNIWTLQNKLQSHLCNVPLF